MNDLRASLQAALGAAYVLDRELGGGGMSRVFLARETALGREVVVKLLDPERVGDMSAERFGREIATAARLQQANIVPVLASGAADGVPYYTMPFVRGESLRARLSAGAPLPLVEAIGLLRDVARALAYAHGEGVIHRDIKPENILVSAGAAVVADFGIAKAISTARTQDGSGSTTGDGTLTQVGSSVGTPAYMAPEQAVGDAVDARADLYAWGVVAYELLAGVHPFAGRSSGAQLIAAHLAEAPRPLSELRPELAPSITALVMQCLAKTPAERPANARDVLTQLTAASTIVSTPDVVRRASPRRPVRARAIAAGIVGLAVLAAMVMRTRGTGDAALAAGAPRTIVVIPFTNLGDSADAYFSAGVSDEIAGRLARLPGLQVVGRSSVLRYAGSTLEPAEIATELHAQYALIGSVRWARASRGGAAGANDSTQVRIVPALVRAGSGAQLWGEPYQERLTDIFKVQSDVAERVATALSITLGNADRAAMRRAGSVNTEARDAELRGRFLLKQRGFANLRSALREFQRAIALDSLYAPAWAGYAEAYAYLPQYGDTSLSTARSNAESERGARRAIALDSLGAEGYLALSSALEHQYRFREALAAVERAVAIDPGNGIAWKQRMVELIALGRVPEAEAYGRRAIQLEPLVPPIISDFSGWFMATGQGDSTYVYAQKTLVLEPEVPIFVMIAELSAGLIGRSAEARALCSKAVVRSASCAMLWPDATDPARVAKIGRALDSIGRLPPDASAIPGAWRAMIYARIGRNDSAFALLQTAIAQREPVVLNVIHSPLLASLHGDARWAGVVKAFEGR